MDFTSSILTTHDTENLHLCFVLDDKTYAVNAKNVLEVATLPLINNPQKLPEYIAGILNYNDLFINVVDIRKVFALPQKNYTISNKIIIIKGEESLFAVIVDKVTDFFAAQPQHIQRVMGETHRRLVKNFYSKDEMLVNIIEIQALEEFVKKYHNSENTTNYNELFPTDEESVFIMQKRRYEIAKIPSLNIDTTTYGQDQYIIFRINEHNYCIHSESVRELIALKNYSLTTIPYTPDFIVGIINLKGSFYTVLDFKSFIGFPSTLDYQNCKSAKIIVLELPEVKLSMLVDDIINIVNISKDDIKIKNETALDSLYIKSEVLIDNEVYNILNIEKLINDERLYVDNSV